MKQPDLSESERGLITRYDECKLGLPLEAVALREYTCPTTTLTFEHGEHNFRATYNRTDDEGAVQPVGCAGCTARREDDVTTRPIATNLLQCPNNRNKTECAGRLCCRATSPSERTARLRLCDYRRCHVIGPLRKEPSSCKFSTGCSTKRSLPIFAL